MQALKTDKNIKLKHDEDCIKFRPSPNFKHMKKYRKCNVEETNEHSSEEPPVETSDELDKKPVNVMIQPPLPPNPPPPDTLITLKKEVVDDEYESGQEIDQPETAMAEYTTEESTEKSDKTMCRDFARGSCTRPACKHAHEIILSQLPGVFTFCKNFQNKKGCNRPKCKFVHASVFEKEFYFRTAYLPPHTLAHIEENSAVQPPPPPPAHEVQQEIPLMYNNPPPAVVQLGAMATVPAVECAPAAETTTIPDVLTTALTLTSPLKREWGKIEEIDGSSRDLDSNEPLVKKCKTCDVTEFRLQCNKNKVEKLMKASEEMHKKTAQLIKKNKRLYTVLSLLKTSNAAKGNPSNVLSSPSFNIRNSDSETTVMDQLSMFFAANNRVASEEKSEASNKSTSTSGVGGVGGVGGVDSVSAVLMKLLLGAMADHLVSVSVSGDSS